MFDGRCIIEGLLWAAEWLPVAVVVCAGAVAGGRRALRFYRRSGLLVSSPDTWDRATVPDTCACGHPVTEAARSGCACGQGESDESGIPDTHHTGHGSGTER